MERTIKQVNVYDLHWRYIRCYWQLTADPDGHIRRVGKFYRKTLN